jgi:protein-tyrosine-phosphatase
MAEAFFNRVAKGKATGFSAGTRPASKVHPLVVEAMREVGVDISNRKPKVLTFEMLRSADRVITMGCNAAEACPASLGPTEDWELDDPEGQPIEKVRQIRDEIEARVDQLVRTVV